MKHIIIVILVLLFPATSLGVYSLPAPYTHDWQPGLTHNVSGGIPTVAVGRTATTDDGAHADGATDDTAHIQSCLTNAAAGTACYLPTGTYVITGNLTIPEGKVLRGNGPANTIILMKPSSSEWTSVQMGSGTDKTTSFTCQNLSVDAAAGDSTVTVADGTGFTIGDFVLIDELNDSTLVDAGDCTWCSRTGRNMGQLNQVSNKAGNVLTLERALAMPYRTAQTGQVCIADLDERSGIEDIKFKLDNTVALNDYQDVIRMTGCAECWIKNIESERTYTDHVEMKFCYMCEIRDSYFQLGHSGDTTDTNSYYGGGAAYGINVTQQSTDCLFENNILHLLRHALIMQGAGSGNVFGYNYMPDTRQQALDWGSPDMCSHGSHSHKTLFEGNYGNYFSMDFIHGSSSHNVMFRNYADGRGNLNNIKAFYVGRTIEYNYYIAYIGNVLGNDTDYPGGTYEMITPSNDTNLVKEIYKTGYNATADTLGADNDANVFTTMLRHRNYDYVSASVKSCGDGGEPGCQGGSSDTPLPNSLYLDDIPISFWCSEQPFWPPINPVGPVIYDIPAKRIYESNTCSTITSSVPTISNPIPSTTQVCTGPTQSVTIGVSTNENATCKYDTNDHAYDVTSGMTFTTTGGTTHSGVTTIPSNASYTWYAMCVDESGNTNTAGTAIPFSIGACGSTPIGPTESGSGSFTVRFDNAGGYTFTVQ